MAKLITAKDMSRGLGTAHFYPGGTSRQFERAATAPYFDGRFSMDKLAYGQGFESVGEYIPPLRIMPSTARDEVDDYLVTGLLIKKPGSDEHVLPPELNSLAPLIEMVAGHEYENSVEAINKICFLTFRSFLLYKDREQIAQDNWHVHKPSTPKNIQSMIERMAITHQSLMWSSRIDPEGLQSEYMVSDVTGSLIQTAPAAEPLAITERENSYNIAAPAFAWRQAEPFEIVHGNGYTFHAAAKPAEDEIGERRSFALITYAPTL